MVRLVTTAIIIIVIIAVSLSKLYAP